MQCNGLHVTNKLFIPKPQFPWLRNFKAEHSSLASYKGLLTWMNLKAGVMNDWVWAESIVRGQGWFKLSSGHQARNSWGLCRDVHELICPLRINEDIQQPPPRENQQPLPGVPLSLLTWIKSSLTYSKYLNSIFVEDQPHSLLAVWDKFRCTSTMNIHVFCCSSVSP